MTEQVLYRKWRPRRFEDVVGQEHASQTLLNALRTGRVSHAYLFCGPRGTGKTSTARLLAKALNCTPNGRGEPCDKCVNCVAISEGRAFDVIEMDAASNRGIDDIRNLRDKIQALPGEGRYKIYIIDEVHQLTIDAVNALLKTLEEPPPKTIFALATTEAHKIPATLASRCQRFDFRRISVSDVVDRLTKICEEERVTSTQEVLAAIARRTAGSLRDAENLLEQIIVGYGARLELEQLREILGMAAERHTRDLAQAIIHGNLTAGLGTIAAVNDEGVDLHAFHRQVMECLRGVLHVKTGSRDTLGLPADETAAVEELATGSSLEQVVQAVKIFAHVDLQSNNYSTLPLELALVDAITASAPAQPVQHAPANKSTPSVAAKLPDAVDQISENPPMPVAEPSPVPVGDLAPPVSRGAPNEQPSPGSPNPTDESDVKEAAVPADESENPVDSLAELKAKWKPIIDAVRGTGQRFKIDALLRSGEPVSVESGRILLGFPFQMFVDRMMQEMEHPGTRKALEDAFIGVLGGSRSVECIVIAKEKKSGGHLMRAAIEVGAKVVDVEERG